MNLNPDRYGMGRIAVNKVRGSIQGVKNPAHAGIAGQVGAFLTHNLIPRSRRPNHCDESLFRFPINGRDQVGRRGFRLRLETALFDGAAMDFRRRMCRAFRQIK
jgi:hypothetical protein